tara:strand:+ start:206 stop:1237 length:1032 start_codon:yes stop_codon:yes gene_type:complete
MSRARQIADLGSPAASGLSNRNLIINGNMLVAQRGTSATNSGYGTVDRTKPEFGGASVTQTQTALTSGGPYNDGHRYFLRCTNTSVSSATSAYLQINQEIEAQNVATSGWNFTSTTSYVTMSFWARSSLAGTYYVLLKSHDGTAQGFTSAFTLVADTWKKIEVTVPGNSNITVNTDSGYGLRCYVVPYFGTDYTTSGHTSDAWQTLSNSNLAPDYAQNWANTANATFDLTGWQVEVGASATPFEHEDYGTTLAKCQRYFIRSSIDGERFEISTQYNSSNHWAAFYFPVSMRAAPAISKWYFSTSPNTTHIDRSGISWQWTSATTFAQTYISDSNYHGWLNAEL